MEYQIAENFEIDTLDSFDALLAPKRLDLLEFFRKPGTAKEAADHLGVPVTRLYYHINGLLEHGFLQVIQENKRGGMTERVFGAAAASFTPSQKFMDQYGNEGFDEIVKLSFANAEAALKRAVDAGLVSMLPPENPLFTLGYHSLQLAEEDLRELVRAIDKLVRGAPEDPDGIRVAGLVAIFPMADS